MLMTIIYFIIVIIVLILIYNYFTSSSNRGVEVLERKDFVERSRNASQYKMYSGDNLPVSKFSNSYTISFWVYINDYKYSLKENKYILMKGKKDVNSDSPIIYLSPHQNNLVVKIKLQSDEDPTEFNTNELSQDIESNVNTTLREDSAVEEINGGTSENQGGENQAGENQGGRNQGERNQGAYMTQTIWGTGGQNSESFKSLESFGNVSNNSAPLPTVSYNKDFYTEINGENLKENFENNTSSKEGFDNHQTEPALEQTNTSSNSNTNSNSNANTNQNAQVESNNNHTTDKYDECMIENIPLQKWVHVAVSIYNNVLDIYQDGKLKSSCVLRGFPEPPLGEIHLTPFGGFSGKVAAVSGFNKAISQDMAYQIYREGPSKTGLLSFFSNLITF